MIVDRIKTVKEERVRRTQGVEGDDDLTPMVEVYRGDNLVAMIVAPQVDRDQGLQAIRVAAAGFSADRVSMVMDAHMASTATNPKTGKDWGPGEMQRACHDDGACAVGLITDCLLIMDAWRSGRIRQQMLPYHVHAEAKTIRWVEDDEMRVLDTDDPNSGLDGIVPSAVREAFAEPLLMDKMTAEFGGIDAFGLSAKQARIHCDCAMAKLLGQDGFQVALVPSDEEEAEIIQASLGADAEQILPSN